MDLALFPPFQTSFVNLHIFINIPTFGGSGVATKIFQALGVVRQLSCQSLFTFLWEIVQGFRSTLLGRSSKFWSVKNPVFKPFSYKILYDFQKGFLYSTDKNHFPASFCSFNRTSGKEITQIFFGDFSFPKNSHMSHRLSVAHLLASCIIHSGGFTTAG